MSAIINGYNVAVSQEQEEEIISFLVEIVSIIVTLRCKWFFISFLLFEATDESKLYTENLNQKLAYFQMILTTCWKTQKFIKALPRHRGGCCSDWQVTTVGRG